MSNAFLHTFQETTIRLQLLLNTIADHHTTMSLPFQILDVFTKTPYLGNPLAVVTIPPNTPLTGTQKHRIAKEFNLSETTFVHDDPDSPERRFDIYTPHAEIPFAGHPTIGTAIALSPKGVRTLIAKAGRIAIEPAANGAVRAAIPHDVRLHQQRLPGWEAQPSDVMQTAIAEAEAGAPLFSIVNGMTFILIELPSLEVLNAVRIGGGPELPADLLDDGWRDGWVTRRYYFVRTGSRAVDGRQLRSIRTRMIKLTMEDPATGSAACALSSYLSLHMSDDRSATYEITQGVEIGRQSTILIDIEVEVDAGGTRSLSSLHLGGTAVQVMRGYADVPGTD